MGTNYKTRITIDGEVKLCKYSKFDGYCAEGRIREFFTTCDLDKMKIMMRNFVPSTDAEYVSHLADKIGLKYDSSTDTFTGSGMDEPSRDFFKTYPEFAYRQPIWELLPQILDGTVPRAPWVDVDETYLSYIIDINLDNNTLVVREHGGQSQTLNLTMLYTNHHTKILVDDSSATGYKCAACKTTHVSNGFNYCPVCGRGIIGIIQQPCNWTDDFEEKHYHDNGVVYCEDEDED